MARLIFMQKGKPVEVRVPEYVLLIWAGVVVALLMTVAVFVAVTFYQAKELRSRHTQLTQQEESLSVCEADLHQYTEVSLSHVISPEMMETLDKQVNSELEGLSHPNDGPQSSALKTAAQMDNQKSQSKTIVQSPHSKPESQEQEVKPTGPTFQVDISHEEIQFKRIELKQDVDVTKLHFLILREPLSEESDKNEITSQGAVVLACATQRGMRFFPQEVGESFHTKNYGAVARKGYSYRIRRSKMFKIDVSTCIENQAPEIHMVAVSTPGDIVGKATYELK